MNNTKTTLIQNSLNLLGDNPNHTFYAVTIRPEWRFINDFPFHTQTTIAEEITQNLIRKYNAHLISQPDKPKNHHLKIISHNAIETKTKYGSPSPAHSHGIWGIHDTLLEKWNTDDFHNRIMELGSFQYEDQKYPLRKVIHSFWKEPFHSSLITKTYPEGWLDYAYKWSGDNDPTCDWSFVSSPLNQNNQSNKEIWDEPYPTHQNILTRLQHSKPLSKRPDKTHPTGLSKETDTGIHKRITPPVSV